MKNKIEEVMEYFGPYDCSQAILSAWSEEYGLDKKTALKISCGFAAGMSRLCHTCGAVTGAYLVIGLKHGKCHPYDNEAKEKTFSIIQDFEKRFVEKHGTTNCRELLGVDLGNDNLQIARKQVQKICPILVKDAAEILESIL